MSPHAPPHLARIAPLLLAGEDVRWMGKPNTQWLLILEFIAACASFVGLFIVMSIISDLPTSLKCGISFIAALAGVAILHCLIGLRTYVITDHRLLIITSFTSDVHDSCELAEIESVERLKVGNSLKVVRSNRPNPIMLWALGNREEVEQALTRQ